MSNKRRRSKIGIVLSALSTLGAFAAHAPAYAAVSSSADEQIRNLQLSKKTKTSMQEIFSNQNFLRKMKLFNIEYCTDGLQENDDSELQAKVDNIMNKIEAIEQICDVGNSATPGLVSSIKDYKKVMSDAMMGDKAKPVPGFLSRLFGSWSSSNYIDENRKCWSKGISSLNSLHKGIQALLSSLKDLKGDLEKIYADSKAVSNTIALPIRTLEETVKSIQDEVIRQKDLSNATINDGSVDEAIARRKLVEGLLTIEADSSSEYALNAARAYLSNVKKEIGGLLDLYRTTVANVKSGIVEDKKAKFEEEEQKRREEEQRQAAQKLLEQKQEEERQRKIAEEKAEAERKAEEEKKQAEREAAERLEKLKQEFETSRQDLIEKIEKKMEAKKVTWDAQVNPTGEAGQNMEDICSILKDEFSHKHEKIDTDVAAALQELNSITKYSDETAGALRKLNDFPVSLGENINNLQQEVVARKEDLLTKKRQLITEKSDLLNALGKVKSDLDSHLSKCKGILPQDAVESYSVSVAPELNSHLSKLSERISELDNLQIKLTDAALESKMNASRSGLDSISNLVNETKKRMVTKAITTKKNAVLNNLKGISESVSGNWDNLQKYSKPNMPVQMGDFAEKCMDKITKKVQSDLASLETLIKNAKSTNPTGDSTVYATKLASIAESELEKYRADRSRKQQWERIFGVDQTLGLREEVNRIKTEDKLNDKEAIKKAVVERLPGNEVYVDRMLEGLYKEPQGELGTHSLTTIYCSGIPGVGKSQAVKSVGTAMGIPVVNFDKNEMLRQGGKYYAEFLLDKYKGQKFLILVDEIEGLTKARRGNETNETLTELLQFMDRLPEAGLSENVVLVGTSNLPLSASDPAVQSRFGGSRAGIVLGDTEFMKRAIGKVLEPVKLNTAFPREQVVKELAEACDRARGLGKNLGVRDVKATILDVIRSQYNKIKTDADNTPKKPSLGGASDFDDLKYSSVMGIESYTYDILSAVKAKLQ